MLATAAAPPAPPAPPGPPAPPAPPSRPTLSSVLVQARPRDSNRRDNILLDLSSVSALYHLKLSQAAQALGISLTSLKTACRKLGIDRWPYRRREEETESDNDQLAHQPTAGRKHAQEDGVGEGREEEIQFNNWIAWYMSFPLEEESNGMGGVDWSDDSSSQFQR